jgi:hypothetical protein
MENAVAILEHDEPAGSLREPALWERAGWCGVAFLATGGRPPRPSVGLVFQDAAAASAIFEGLHGAVEATGAADGRGRLSLAFVEGGEAARVGCYTAVLAVDGSAASDGRPGAQWERSLRVRSSPALASFAAAYRTSGGYALVPIVLDAGGEVRALHHLAIDARRAEFRRVADAPPVDAPAGRAREGRAER